MSTILLGGYENQNAGRHYPFEDTASMCDQDGNVLPTDFIIDAHLYPIDLGDMLFLSKIDQHTGTLTFAAVSSQRVVGTAQYQVGQSTAPIVETDLYDRQIGVVVFGDGVADVTAGRTVRVFDSTATTFCPSAYIDVHQTGVRGFILPDGTLMTGAVTFEGRDGITVTARTAYGLSVLRFDAHGTIPVTDDACIAQTPPICQLHVEHAVGSPFAVSAYGPPGSYTLSITARGFTLDDICAAQKDRYLPSADGTLPDKVIVGEKWFHYVPCYENPGPGEDTDTAYAFDMDLCGSGMSALNIVAPSVPGARNPISIRKANVAGAKPNRMLLPAVTRDVESIDALAKAFRLPPLMQNGITIGFKGLKVR